LDVPAQRTGAVGLSALTFLSRQGVIKRAQTNASIPNAKLALTFEV